VKPFVLHRLFSRNVANGLFVLSFKTVDSDCGPGLICYQRDAGGQPVPGCLRGDKEKSATDYCVPEWATLPPTDFPTEAPTGETPGPTGRPTESPTWSPTSSPTGRATSEMERNVLQEFSCNIIGLFCK
jgi:hypothetical protein